MSLQGTYQDIKQIGAGGGGTVYRAYHVRMQKYVVLKKILDGIKNQVDVRGELDILKNLRHQYLPSVIDFVEEQGAIFTVMDYIQGESFEALLARGVRFTPAQVAKYAAQLSEVLTYLHSQKTPIVHGDIKPANIMLTPEDNICLIDFNISQLQNGTVGTNVGYSPGYSSPEQVRMLQAMRQFYAAAAQNPALKAQGYVPGAQERMDVRSDIYSAGATLYTILCGGTPAPDFSQIVPVGRVVNCSEGLEYVITRSMEFEPARRFQTAAEMHKAVVNMAKMDKRYKRLVLRQNLRAVFSILAITGCLMVSILGWERIQTEKQEAYEELVEQLGEYREEGLPALEEFEKTYSEAVKYLPDKAAAYLQKAMFYYENRRYEELVEFIERDASPHYESFAEEETGEFYFLHANGYLEMDDVSTALTYYREALKHDAYDSIYYSDYATALVRNDNLEEARQVLEKAVKKGLSNDRVLLVQGEIACKEADMAGADQYFSSCIAETKDAYVKLRAYMIWAKTYNEKENTEYLQKRLSILEKGVKEVAENDQSILLEQLAQTQIDLFSQTREAVYCSDALATLKTICDHHWDTYNTHTNIGVMYVELGEFEAARTEFEGMLTTYGEDYRTYKKLAFVELKKQESLDSSDRDYSRFQEYYKSTKELFKDSNVQKDSDQELKLLEQYYKQLIDGNWLN